MFKKYKCIHVNNNLNSDIKSPQNMYIDGIYYFDDGAKMCQSCLSKSCFSCKKELTESTTQNKYKNFQIYKKLTNITYIENHKDINPSFYNCTSFKNINDELMIGYPRYKGEMLIFRTPEFSIRNFQIFDKTKKSILMSSWRYEQFMKKILHKIDICNIENQEKMELKDYKYIKLTTNKQCNLRLNVSPKGKIKTDIFLASWKCPMFLANNKGYVNTLDDLEQYLSPYSYIQIVYTIDKIWISKTNKTFGTTFKVLELYINSKTDITVTDLFKPKSFSTLLRLEDAFVNTSDDYDSEDSEDSIDSVDTQVDTDIIQYTDCSYDNELDELDLDLSTNVLYCTMYHNANTVDNNKEVLKVNICKQCYKNNSYENSCDELIVVNI